MSLTFRIKRDERGVARCYSDSVGRESSGIYAHPLGCSCAPCEAWLESMLAADEEYEHDPNACNVCCLTHRVNDACGRWFCALCGRAHAAHETHCECQIREDG